MKSARDAFADFIKDFDFKAPEIVCYTNVTGGQISDPEVIKEALVNQVVSSVRFEDNLRNMAADNGINEFYECGPGKVLAGFAKRIDRSLVVTPMSEFEEVPE
jgi:[acyl-carrier-protein] S-malonyltransferase